MAKVVLFCGLPGSGKTTTGRKLHGETGAFRLCPDEWMADLGIDLFNEAVRERLEIRLWELGKELLRAGQDVILENGLWSRQEREDKLRDVRELGVEAELHWMDVPLEELWRRVQIRNDAGRHDTVSLTREQIAHYATFFQPPDEAELTWYDRVVVHRG